MGSETNNQEQAQAFTIANQGFNSASALQIRLETAPIIKEIELYLKGISEEYAEDKDGALVINFVKVSEAKANKEGIHSILAWIRSTINTQVVQGNFQNFDELSNYIYNYRLDLAQYVMVNLYNWGVAEHDYTGLIDMIMIQVKPFMSRLVGDGERKSYAQTIKHSETSQSNLRERGGGFKIRGF